MVRDCRARDDGRAGRLARRLPRWVEAMPSYAIGGVAMFWVIERVSAFVRL
jgi:hypothetical protein